MLKQKLCACVCALVMCFTLLPLGTPALAAGAGAADGYHRQQIDGKATVFYDAMKAMYDSGDLRSGTAKKQLSDFTQEELAAFAAGDPALTTAFQSARDAFMMDYADIFYVDFTKLTLRIGKQGNDYVAMLGSGTHANYYAPGFADRAQVGHRGSTSTKRCDAR